MSDDRHLDEKISGLVRSADREVPPGLEARIRTAAESVRPAGGIWGRISLLTSVLLRRRHGRVLSHRRLKILALVPGAAAAVALAAFVILPALRKPPVPRISEIRTEFEIADKNIKIVFFQRPDFKLTQEE